MAGVVGFEPTIHATKKHCLTTWLHPNCEGGVTLSVRGDQAQKLQTSQFLNEPFQQQFILTDAAASSGVLNCLIVVANRGLSSDKAIQFFENLSQLCVAFGALADNDQIWRIR